MMSKFFSRLLIIVVLIVGGFFLLRSFKIWPAFTSLFSAKELVIDETPILVTRIQSIAELMTVTNYDEVVVDSLRLAKQNLVTGLLGYATPLAMPVLPADQIVLIAKGRVIAGLDMNDLKAENIYIKDDSIAVALPSAKILDVITNPSDFETFTESGDWTPSEVTMVKNKARGVLQKRALASGILQRANEQGLQLVDNFLKASGFKKRSVRLH